MTRMRGISALAAAAVTGLCLTLPAHADVKSGVDAWSRGDYADAAKEWRKAADAGDPDAQFNLAQAYRLGRGVPQDVKQAEHYYAMAARKGHMQAADNYGLLLFQDGRRQAALPYVEAAAGRGDPRAQYLLGIAHFNGDFVAKDWVRAYALLTLANASELPQAPAAIAQMDQYIPLDQRQRAAALARTMQEEADATRARQIAAADLGVSGFPPARPAPGGPVPVIVPPSVAVPADGGEAAPATGAESPAEAGADFARPAIAAVSAAPPVPVPAPTPASAPAKVAEKAREVTKQSPARVADRGGGPWKVQLGAFSVPGNAEKLWARLGGKGPLAGRNRILLPAGRLTRLLAGGFASQAEAQAACRELQRGGHSCLVMR